VDSPILLKVTLGKAAVFKVVDLRMAKRAVLQLEILQLLMQCLMLANLARVILFLEDAHATRNARRVMCCALLAGDIKLVDDAATLRAVELLFLLRVVR